jgi:hypothetical protein
MEFLGNDAFGLGETINVRISVRNVGNAAVTIPLLRPHEARDLISSRRVDMVTLAFRIIIDLPGKEATGFLLGSLYGAADEPTSMQVLQPGQSVEIVGPVRLDPWPSSITENLREPTAGQIRASMAWRGQSWQSISSDNTLQVHVAPRRR